MTENFCWIANAIRELNYDTIKTILASHKITVIAEVIDEVFTEKKDLFKDRVADMLNEDYDVMKEIFSQHPREAYSLIDYMNNKGTGDICLVSYACRNNKGKLPGIACATIVSNDKGVQCLCKEVGINYLSVQQFKDKCLTRLM